MVPTPLLLVVLVPISAIGAEWAIPVNTALIIVLALINRRTKKHIDDVHDEVQQVKEIKAGRRRVDRER